jgi:hypothetical protein
MNEKLDEIIRRLHNLWDEASCNCIKQNHDAETIVLDYGHVQVVMICKQCYENTSKKQLK